MRNRFGWLSRRYERVLDTVRWFGRDKSEHIEIPPGLWSSTAALGVAPAGVATSRSNAPQGAAVTFSGAPAAGTASASIVHSSTLAIPGSRGTSVFFALASCVSSTCEGKR